MAKSAGGVARTSGGAGGAPHARRKTHLIASRGRVARRRPESFWEGRCPGDEFLHPVVRVPEAAQLDGTADGLVRLPRDAKAAPMRSRRLLFLFYGSSEGAPPGDLGAVGAGQRAAGFGPGRLAGRPRGTERGLTRGRPMRRRRAATRRRGDQDGDAEHDALAVDLGGAGSARVTADEARARVARRHAARRRLPGRPSPRGRHRSDSSRSHDSSSRASIVRSVESRCPHRPRRREGSARRHWQVCQPSPKTSSRAVRIAVSSRLSSARASGARRGRPEGDEVSRRARE